LRRTFVPIQQAQQFEVNSRKVEGITLKQVRAFFDKHIPTLGVLILVLFALGVFRHYWGDPAKAQTVGALFGFFAAAILIGVTWEYVRVNQQSLALQRAQWEQQNKVVLVFGVRRYRGKARIWIANIGKTDFLISQLRVRRKNGEEINRNERRVVASGSRQGLALPEELWAGNPLLSTFDIRLRYESQHDSGVTPTHAFTLLVGNGSAVIKIRRGIDDTWWVTCPQCKAIGGSMMTENLENFDAAAERQKIMESELRVTCPDHSSQWSDSVEQMRERRENRPALEED
jgi:hypothetical protein